MVEVYQKNFKKLYKKFLWGVRLRDRSGQGPTRPPLLYPDIAMGTTAVRPLRQLAAIIQAIAGAGVRVRVRIVICTRHCHLEKP
jgi:hypothetical protein